MTKFFTVPAEGDPIFQPPIANVIGDPRAPEELMDGYTVTEFPPLDEAGRNALRAGMGTLPVTGTKPATLVHSPAVEVRNWREHGNRQIPIGTITMLGARKRGLPPS